ncbi:MAG TPA: tetratricopeptide repeat protein, partial [Chitinophagales bacterium]
MKKGGLFLIFWVVAVAGFAQQTFYYTDKNADYKKGLLLFTEKNYMSARNTLQQFVLAEKPQGLILDETDYMIAVSAAENNDDDAEKLLDNFLKKHSDSYRTAYINFYLGRYYYKNNKYQEAIDKLAGLSPNEIPEKYQTEYKFQLGYCYFVKKKFDEAQPLFASIRNIKEKYYYPSNYYYAFISFYKNQYDEALKSFLQIEDSEMFSSVIPYYVSQIYYLKKDYSKTIDYIKSHIDKPNVLYVEEMNQLLGECYFQLSDYEKALPLLEKRVAKGEKVRKEDIYELAYSQYKLQKYNDAVANLLQLNLVDDTLGQNATYVLADCYLQLGDKEKAKAAFQSASTKKFDTQIKHEALFNYAKLSLESGNPTECVSALKQ